MKKYAIVGGVKMLSSSSPHRVNTKKSLCSQHFFASTDNAHCILFLSASVFCRGISARGKTIFFEDTLFWKIFETYFLTTTIRNEDAAMQKTTLKDAVSSLKPGLGTQIDTVLLSILVNILSLAIPIVILQVYDRILPNKAYNTATLLFLGAAAAVITEAFLRYARTHVLSQYAERFEYASSLLAFKKLFRTDIASAMNMGTGALTQRLNDISSIRDHYAGQSYLVLYDLPFSFLFLAAIWYIGRELVLVPLILFGVALTLALLAGKFLQAASHQVSKMEDRRINYITSILNSLVSLKSLGGERLTSRRFRHKTKKLIADRTRLDRISHAISDIVAMLGYLTTVAVVVVGAIFVMQGKLSTGGLAACTILAGRSLGPVVALVVLWTQLQRTAVAESRIHELWSLPEDSTFSKDDRAAGPSSGEVQLSGVKLERGGKPLSLDMHLAPGDKFVVEDSPDQILPALVGLLIGSSSPAEGEVLVGGKPLSEFSRSAYRKAVGFIPRQASLFRGSIMENLTLFQPAEERRALELSEKLGLSAFVYKMPSGFKTNVGDMLGGPIESGILQRVAIVRALINNPKVLILNEADEGIDLDGKERLQNLLREMSGITVLLCPADSTMRQAFDETLRLNADTIHRVKTQEVAS